MLRGLWNSLHFLPNSLATSDMACSQANLIGRKGISSLLELGVRGTSVERYIS